MRTQKLGFFILSTVSCLLTPVFSAQRIEWNVDLNRPQAFEIILYRGETIDLVPRLTIGATASTLETNAAVELRYIPSTGWNTNTFYSATGSVYNAANGQASVHWTATNCATNSAYLYSFVITESSGPIYRLNGTLTLIDTVGNTSTGTPLIATDVTRDEYLATNVYFSALAASTSNGLAAAYSAADTVVSNGLAGAYAAADTVVSNGLAAAYAAADTVVSNGLAGAYAAADTVVSNALATAFPQSGTNDAPTLFTPRYLGDVLVIYSSTNKAYRGYGITTNDWNN